MKLFLIRHGQSEANLRTCYTGQSDVSLTQMGREQAASVKAILQPYTFDKVYSSDLSRAAETCAIALPGAEYEKTPLLREYDVGELVGTQVGLVKRMESDDPADRPDYTAYGGENARMVGRRVRAFLEQLEKCDHTYVAAFSHFGFINCALRYTLGTAYDSKAIKTQNCAVHVLEYDGGRWRIAALNYGKTID